MLSEVGGDGPLYFSSQIRIRRHIAEDEVSHGDIVALALDTLLRAKGYPPNVTSRNTEAR